MNEKQGPPRSAPRFKVGDRVKVSLSQEELNRMQIHADLSAENLLNVAPSPRRQGITVITAPHGSPIKRFKILSKSPDVPVLQRAQRVIDWCPSPRIKKVLKKTLADQQQDMQPLLRDGRIGVVRWLTITTYGRLIWTAIVMPISKMVLNLASMIGWLNYLK